MFDDEKTKYVKSSRNDCLLFKTKKFDGHRVVEVPNFLTSHKGFTWLFVSVSQTFLIGWTTKRD